MLMHHPWRLLSLIAIPLMSFSSFAKADNLTNLSDVASTVIAWRGPYDIAGEGDFSTYGRALDDDIAARETRLLMETGGTSNGSGSLSGDATSVPEPSSLLLLGLGATGALATCRSKRWGMLAALLAMVFGIGQTAMAADVFMVSNTGEIRTFAGISGDSTSIDSVGTFSGGTLVNTIASYGTYQGFTSLPNGSVYGVNSAGGVDMWASVSDFTSNTNMTTVSTGDPYGALVTDSPRSGIHGISFDGATGGLYAVLEGPDANEGDLTQFSTLKQFLNNDGTIYTPNGYGGNIMVMYYPDEDAPATADLPNTFAGTGSNYFHITGGGQLEGWEGTLTQAGFGMYGTSDAAGGTGGGGNRSYQVSGFGSEVIGAFALVPDTEEMTLLVDTTTGIVSLQRPVSDDRTIDFLRVSSPGGGLLGSGYLGLGSTDELPAGGELGGGGWDLAPSNDGNTYDKREYYAFTSEGSLGNSTITTSGDLLPLGLFYDTDQDLQDLVLYYDQVDPSTGEYLSQSIILGVYIDYVESTGLPGDYNSDGNVDLADYTVWRNNLGGDGTALPNRSVALDGSAIGQLDYMVWKANFGASSSGLGSLAGASVPEPTSIVLLAMMGLAGLAYRTNKA